jgi:predicted aconitase
VQLDAQERAMLAGAEGPGVRKAIEIVVALGKIYGADRLVPVESVQVAGVSYKNLGAAGLAFLREWSTEGSRVCVPTMLNPAGIDLERWRALGFDRPFAMQQSQVVAAFTAMGIESTCTCTPYLVGRVPELGTHLAWAESSAVSFANSVLGARTNREGGPSALAAAISGRTAHYGLHCDENRLASIEVVVRCPVRGAADWGALGYLVGKAARNRIPLFQGLPLDGPSENSRALWDPLKALGAAMAASGAVALYHVAGVTPEARQTEMLRPEHETLVIDSLAAGYRALGSDGGPLKIDLVWFGCPHASLDEIAQLAGFAAGKRFVPAVWITTSRQVREAAQAAGHLVAIEAAGGEVVADTCVVVAPVEGRFRSMATLSGKGGYYAPSYLGFQVRYGDWEQLQQVMLTGRWKAGDDS